MPLEFVLNLEPVDKESDARLAEKVPTETVDFVVRLERGHEHAQAFAESFIFAKVGESRRRRAVRIICSGSSLGHAPGKAFRQRADSVYQTNPTRPARWFPERGRWLAVRQRHVRSPSRSRPRWILVANDTAPNEPNFFRGGQERSFLLVSSSPRAGLGGHSGKNRTPTRAGVPPWCGRRPGRDGILCGNKIRRRPWSRIPERRIKPKRSQATPRPDKGAVGMSSQHSRAINGRQRKYRIERRRVMREAKAKLLEAQAAAKPKS